MRCAVVRKFISAMPGARIAFMGQLTVVKSWFPALVDALPASVPYQSGIIGSNLNLSMPRAKPFAIVRLLRAKKQYQKTLRTAAGAGALTAQARISPRIEPLCRD
jgi:hypothetical protein